MEAYTEKISKIKIQKSDSNVPQVDQKENAKFLLEVNNIEKKLWTLIHSKGILHPDVKELYLKAGFTYEQIFISDLKHEELQEVEYYLWKLHYKHIDEFRKGIKTDVVETHMEGFKFFLAKATEFYQNLILKVRGYYKMSQKSKSGQKCRFLCHRFYICLGDLERYKEQYLKTSDNPNWSNAATYYLEAAKAWPDSGNPHNQLAVLATYVGDEFLALYHCVRSLAVKEPFPGAWNNLILLFEKNRSSPLQSLSIGAQFNFLNPSDRHFSKELTAGVDLWSLVVRTTSFFFLKSSFDEFGCAFASTMRELDAALAADDINLEAMLESYQVMNLARKGPYRILHLIVVFIFIFHNLACNQEFNGSDNTKEETNLALTMVFIVMGRLIERCLETTPLDSCPLLPAVLVFLEYLPSLLEKTEECRFDDKSEIAISYFFGSLVDILNRLKLEGKQNSPQMVAALWEDHELRALAPLAPVQALLDFSSDGNLRENSDKGKEFRLLRIINSSIEITRKQKGSQKWLFFDKERSRFYTATTSDRPVSSELLSKEQLFHGNEAREGSIDQSNGNCVAIACEKERYVPAEEEEVILLKPLVRCQSAPIYSSGTATNELRADNKTSGNQTASSDDSLRRTSSLFVENSSQEAKATSFSFSQGLKDIDLQRSHLEEGAISGRPPSLSAWVVDNKKGNGRLGVNKPNGLSPIDETAPITSFDGLPNSGSTEYSFAATASLYSPPTPSAPLLPENASWIHDGACTNKAESFSDHTRSMLNQALPLPGFKNPAFVGISSSEWLRRYRESQNLGPAYSYQAQRSNNLKDFLARGSSKFSLLDRYGTPDDQPTIRPGNSTFYPQIYSEGYEFRDEKTCNGHQRTANAYGLSVMASDYIDDPGPFLRFLREKELNEYDPRLRGPSPAYMKN